MSLKFLEISVEYSSLEISVSGEYTEWITEGKVIVKDTNPSLEAADDDTTNISVLKIERFPGSIF